MDDSDDYGFDEIELDEQTLAILEREEEKYQNLLDLNQPPGNTRELVDKTPDISKDPVNKRHKTGVGWKPGLGAHLDYDDLPEISVRGDGSYGVRTAGQKQNSVNEGSIHGRHNTPMISSASGKPSSLCRQPLAHRSQRVPYAQSDHTTHSKPVDYNFNRKSNRQEVVKNQNSHQLESHVQQLESKLEEVRVTCLFLYYHCAQTFSPSCVKQIPRLN